MPENGNEEKFLALLKQHEKIMYKISHSYCTHAEDRKDLVQEMIIQMWSAFPKYDERFKFSTWFYRISLNTAITFYRRKKKLGQITTGDLEKYHENEIATDSAREAWHVEELYRIIYSLDEMNRALMLLYLDDLSYKEIALVLGISESNVSTRISRIKQKLKTRFNTD